MTAERIIHFAMFILLLVGLCGISSWASSSYLRDNLMLEVAGTALIWGMILAVLYLGFKQLDWDWWD